MSDHATCPDALRAPIMRHPTMVVCTPHATGPDNATSPDGATCTNHVTCHNNATSPDNATSHGGGDNRNHPVGARRNGARGNVPLRVTRIDNGTSPNGAQCRTTRRAHTSERPHTSEHPADGGVCPHRGIAARCRRGTLQRAPTPEHNRAWG